jgi:hypothetical protein
MNSIAAAAPLLQPSGDTALEARTGELFRRLDRCEGGEEAQGLAGLLVKAVGFTYFSYGVPLLAAERGRPNDTGYCSPRTRQAGRDTIGVGVTTRLTQ